MNYAGQWPPHIKIWSGLSAPAYMVLTSPQDGICPDSGGDQSRLVCSTHMSDQQGNTAGHKASPDCILQNHINFHSSLQFFDVSSTQSATALLPAATLQESSVA